MSEAVIGLTIIAIGTSLPELVTSIAAVSAGQGGILLICYWLYLIWRSFG